MNNFFLKTSVFLTIIFLFGCNDSDDGPEKQSARELGINTVTELQVVPMELVEFKIEYLSNDINDSKLYFDGKQISISSLIEDGIEVIIPFESTYGVKNITLNHKGTDYELGSIKIIDPIELFPLGIALMETEDPEFPYIMIDSINNIIVPHVIGDRIESMTVQHTDGKSTYIKLDESNLPSNIHNEDYNLIFEKYDYDYNIVNIAYFLKDDIENATFYYNFSLNEDIIAQAQEKSKAKAKFPVVPMLSRLNTIMYSSFCVIGSLIDTGVFDPRTGTTYRCERELPNISQFANDYEGSERQRNAYYLKKMKERGSPADFNLQLQNAKAAINDSKKFIDQRKTNYEQTRNSLNNMNLAIIGVWEQISQYAINCRVATNEVFYDIVCNPEYCFRYQFLNSNTLIRSYDPSQEYFQVYDYEISGNILTMYDQDPDVEPQYYEQNWEFSINGDIITFKYPDATSAGTAQDDCDWFTEYIRK